MAAPDARTDNYSVTEDQLLVGSANGFLNNDSDPDGDPLSIIRIDGLPFSFGTPITLASGAKLTINADGSFQYDQNGSFTHLSAGQTANDIFTYTISDGKLGFDTSSVCMTISGLTQNPIPILPQPLIINGAISDVVEEEQGLPGGIEDTTNSNGLDTDESGPNTVTNVSAGSFVPLITGGIDGTLSFAFAPLGGNPAVQTVSNGSLTSHGKQVYFDTEGPNLIGYYNASGDSTDYDPATDTKVFTMTLAPTGAYAFTLHAPVDQAIGGEDSIAINLNGRVTVTDSGGPGADTNVPLNASITVIDDTPDAVVANTTAAAIVLDETRPLGTDSVGGVAPTGVQSATGDFSANFAAAAFGADGAGSVSYKLVLSAEGIGSGLYALDNTDTTTGAATAVLSNVGPTWHVVAAADFNGDGKSDILWQGDDGTAAMWLMDGTNTTFVGAVGPFNPGPTWHIKGTGDFNGDGKSDILWQGDDGTAAMWLMDGANATFVGAAGPFNPGPNWEIKGTGDFNGDGKSDILWQGDDGTAAMWLMDGANATFVGAVGPFNPGPSWEIKGTGDFNGDGKSDILWQGDDGTAAMWLMDGPNATFVGAAGPFNPGPSWEIKGTGDFNGDGKSDIIWQGDDGTAAMWLMDGANATFVGAVGQFNPGQKIKGTGDFNGDAKADILWQNDSGLPSIWTMVGATDTDGIGQGAEILLYVNNAGTVITGSTAGSEAGILPGNTYFTITVDNNPASPTFGDVTFTQTQNIWHDDTNDPDDPEALTTAAAGDLTLTLTVTDADGDTASASINLGTGVFVIQDDGPVAVVIGTPPAAIVLDESPVAPGGDGIVSATADLSVNFSAANFGTDGASSATYALVLTGSNVASGLFALDAADTTAGDGDGIGQGASIVLNKVGNDILGQVGAVTYFKISVDGNGVVTFAQLKNIWHPNTGSNDEAATLTLSDPALLQLTVTDADGDTASAGLNLGVGVFTIEDDGPDAVVANAVAAAIVLDETRPVGTETDGDSAPAGLDTVTVNLAGNFAAATDFGSDGPGSATYSLVLTGSNVASGLFALDAADTTAGDGDGIGQGAQIVLNQSGNTITGSAGGTNYFTITLNPATGQVTFTQLNNIWHASTASDDDTATLTLANANLLTLVQTVTDADGDVDTAAINLGTGVFQIEDDGPDAVVANAVAAAIVLDETRPVGTETDGDSAPAGLDTVTVNLAGNFAAATDFGSDGPGSATYSLVLTGSNVASGLFALDAADTTAGDGDGIGQGAQIVLNQSGNTITGSAGGTNYFTITLNPATGQVTFTQLNNIWHASTASDDDTATLTLANANLLTLVQTVTDADGDSDTAAINLGTGVFQIEDDGPDAVVANAVAAAIVLDETRPVGTETDGDSAPAGLDTVTVNLAGNFAAATDFGSDGPGSATYSLVLTGSNVASGLFALDAADTTAGDGDGIGQGAEIVLNRAGNTITGSAGGTNYFTITLNPATGQVTFTQLNNIWHASTASDDDTATLTLANANLLTLVQTVTDADGDSDTAAINLGTGVFQIEDDGPDAVVANAVAAAIVLDETRPVGTETDGDSAPAGLDTVTVNLAGNFAAATDFGSDGPGSATYSLALTGSNVASGLFALDAADTTAGDGDGIGQGAQIVLNRAGNTITGSAGLTNYFTITLNPATGQVTFTQLNNIWHASTASDDDTATLTLANANLLTLVQTVTDADGDSDTAAINLGTGVFQIEDDGPDAVVANATAAAIVLDESPVAPNGDGIVSATGNFALNFGSPPPTDFGSDGPGSATYSLVLTGSNVASGLFALDPADTSAGDGDGIGQGAQILLNQSGNVITGSVGATTYFTIQINPATGVVTFTDNTANNLWHANTGNPDDPQTLTLANANLLTLVQTVTDADGDSDTAAINLGSGVFTIEDDGPDAVVVNPTAAAIVLDESPVAPNGDGIVSATGNFALNFAPPPPTDFGTDGPGGVSYALVLNGTNVASGLFALDPADTSAGDGDGIGQGVQILLNQSGNVITGSVGATTYFTIQINPATGAVTFTDNTANNLWHANTGNPDDPQTLTLANANLLTLVQTVTDADGDSDTAAINLGSGVFTIEDDGPDVVIAPDHAVVMNGAGAPVDFELDQDANLLDNYGTDSPGTVRFTVQTGEVSPLTSGGQAIKFVVSDDGLMLTGVAGPANTPVFIVTLNPANGTYTVDMEGTVDLTTRVDFSSSAFNFIGGNGDWTAFTSVDGATDLLLTPQINGLPDGTINSTANAGGVGGGGGGQNVGSNETFRIDFVTNLSTLPSTGPGDYDQLGNRNHVFDNHYQTQGASAVFSSTLGSTVLFAAFNDSDAGGNDVVDDGVGVPITGIAIAFNNDNLFIDLTVPGLPGYTVGGHLFTITGHPGGTVSVGGVVTGTEVAVFGNTTYNAVEYTYEAGLSGSLPFNIGDFGASVPTTDPIPLNIPIELVDSDGDSLASMLGVTLTAAGQGIQNHSADLVGDPHAYSSTLADPHIIGSDFADTLTGDAAINVLFGNAGNDVISGGAGNDVLIGGTGNDTLTGGTGLDRMIFGEVGAANQDTINSYAGTGADRDILDLSDLLDANFGGGSVVSNFVRLEGAGANLNVQVDTDGLANGVNFATVATLTSYNTIGNIVTTYFEGAEHQLTDLIL